MELNENLCDGVEAVNEFCYLGDTLKTSGGSEAAVTARMRIGWIKFRECSELLLGKRFSLKIKARVYQSCVRSAILYGSETLCLREKEMDIFGRTERAMCGAKLANRKNAENRMDMLGLNQTIDKMVKASGVRWLGYVLRKEDGDVVRSAPEFNFDRRRKRGRPKRTWRKQVEEERLKAGLNLKDAHNRSKWRERVHAISIQGQSSHLH